MQLVSVRADARMLHYGAEVSFTQTYKNPGSTPLDATYDHVACICVIMLSRYVFPVPFQGTVTAFEASTGCFYLFIFVLEGRICVLITFLLTAIDGVAIITHVRDRQAAPKERQDDPQQSQPVIMY